MQTRLVAIAAWAVVQTATVYAQGAGAAAGTSHPRGDAGASGGAKSHVPPSPPAPAPTTASPNAGTPLLPGAGIVVAPEDAGRPPRPEASPGTPANPSGLKKPD
ncbi:hypothetical protein [Paraburkholderia phenoliruptrix]|uniref:Uncharacterized protein n=2 Tax=Paraburkholderia phenoliruptrix TaxID=252970 RepID=K0DS82_9BURK|nr:hypothetical protein [Paraburkholderia phenoliruptrix]AFT87805.1 hypothetical protein BUPH_00335 [Paraburkholderia phenoliruptrix BR3459a]MDR6418039.1 hypothetical protein [Paraburkholderia phenoliruptrix]CAB4046710.1 hypothetical protein LMG9964_00341 [Paraburkholderia phenoliruptrix]